MTLLGQHPDKIAEVRGRGFLRGVRLHQTCEVGVLVAALRERGMLTVPAAENTLRLLPPLVISDEEIGIALDLLAQALAE